MTTRAYEEEAIEPAVREQGHRACRHRAGTVSLQSGSRAIEPYSFHSILYVEVMKFCRMIIAISVCEQKPSTGRLNSRNK